MIEQRESPASSRKENLPADGHKRVVDNTPKKHKEVGHSIEPRALVRYK